MYKRTNGMLLPDNGACTASICSSLRHFLHLWHWGITTGWVTMSARMRCLIALGCGCIIIHNSVFIVFLNGGMSNTLSPAIPSKGGASRDASMSTINNHSYIPPKLNVRRKSDGLGSILLKSRITALLPRAAQQLYS